MHSKAIHPAGRDLLILEHVARHRLTTNEVVRRVVVPGLSQNATAKLLTRLCSGDYLARYVLLHPQCYYTLGRVAAQQLGLSTYRCDALGPQALPTEFALLVHANLGQQHRLRLLNHEVRARYPWLPPLLAKAPHCLLPADEALELVRVDLGGSADHLARKCVHDLDERLKLPALAQQLQRGLFRMAIVTGTRPKAAAIRDALDRQGLSQRLLMHFTVTSDLFTLLGAHTRA
jgi:hypothetical protein